MELQGRTCVLYPLAIEGATVPPGCDLAVLSAAYQDQLVKLLTKAGMVLIRPGFDAGADYLMLTGRLVRIERGSRWMPMMFGMLGALVGKPTTFEVEGQLGDSRAAFAQIHAEGKSYYSLPWGANMMGMKAAARLAARFTLNQTKQALKYR